MAYTQFQPHPALAPYIDAYWTVTGNYTTPTTNKILPDGCIDIIFNLGADCKTDMGNLLLKNEHVYLVGTMTRFQETILQHETRLIGIRFKPAGFPAFYQYDSLHQLTDRTVEFERKLAPVLCTMGREPITNQLNHFFLNRLSHPQHSMLAVIDNIQEQHGQIDVRSLARKHFTTVRQLERAFKRYIGATPKEFINLVRYQYTLSRIRESGSATSLLHIAFECGYYDHAHLTNEIKRYTGVAPTQL